MVPRNSIPEGFSYIWQSKWVGIIAIKTERTQIHFLSDVLVVVASLDLKVSNSRRVWIHEKNLGDAVRRLGTMIQRISCAHIRCQYSLDRLEMVRWESVPRGFSACAWKLSSSLFSRPDWLPLGLRGWVVTRHLYGISALVSQTSCNQFV